MAEGAHTLIRPGSVAATALHVGAPIVIYLAADTAVKAISIPRALQEPATLALTGLALVPFKPDWARVSEGLPFFTVVQTGAGQLMGAANTLLLNRGIQPHMEVGGIPNTVASMAVAGYLVYRGETLAAQEGSKFATAWKSMTRGGTLAEVGVLGGVFQTVNAAGAVQLGSWAGGMATDATAWVVGADGPDYSLVKNAYGDVIADVYGETVSTTFGPLIQGMWQGAALVSPTLQGALDKEIDRKIGIQVNVNDLRAKDINMDLIRIVLDAYSGSKGKQISGEALATALSHYGTRNKRLLSFALARFEETGRRVPEAHEIFQCIAEGGQIRDSARLQRYLSGLLKQAEKTGSLKTFVDQMLRQKEAGLKERLGLFKQKGILDFQGMKDGDRLRFIRGQYLTPQTASVRPEIMDYLQRIKRLKDLKNQFDSTSGLTSTINWVQ